MCMGRSVLPRGCIARAQTVGHCQVCAAVAEEVGDIFILTGGLAKDRGLMAGLYYYHVDFVKYGVRVIEDEFF